MGFIRFITTGKPKRRPCVRVSSALLGLLLALTPLSGQATVEQKLTELTLGAVSSITKQLFPLDVRERDIASILDLVYDSLIELDDDYQPKPCLAESWKESNAGKTWTLTIRDNVQFHNGQPLTAYDCAATITQILTMANNEDGLPKGTYSTMPYYIKSVRADNDRTLVITANRPYYGLLYALTFPILPANEVQNDMPSGTGPYIIYNYSPCQYLWLSVNENYWQVRPQIREIMFEFSANNKAMMSSYEYSQLDGIATRSVAASQYQSGRNAYSLSYRTRQLETLLFNHKVDTLASLNLRKAIRAAINIDLIASQVYMKMAVRTDTPMVLGTWMYQDSTEYGYQKALAQQLLAEDGWTDSNDDGVLDKIQDGTLVDLSLRLFYYEEPGSSVRGEAADYIAQQLGEIGVKVKVTAYSYAGIQEKLDAGSFDLALVAYNMDSVPDPGFFLIPNQQNYGRYRDETMSKLVTALRSANSFSAFQQCLYDIQDHFARQCPFVCLYYRMGMVLTRCLYTNARDVRELELYRGLNEWTN